MNDSTPSVTWWLEMVKIARKGFEVLSKSEGQATAWRPRNLARMKKRVLAFSWGTNQTMMVTLKWGSNLGWSCGSDLIHLELTHICWMESIHMLKMAMLKERIKFHMTAPSLDDHCGIWHLGLREINSSASISVFIWSWVYMYAVLLRGMHHVDRYLFISAQANPCEVRVFLRAKRTNSFCWVWRIDTRRVWYLPGHSDPLYLLGLVHWEFQQKSGVLGVGSPCNRWEFERLVVLLTLWPLGLYSQYRTCPVSILDVSGIRQRLHNC